MTKKHTGRASLEGIREFIKGNSLSDYERELLERLGEIIDKLDPPEPTQKEKVFIFGRPDFDPNVTKIVFTDIPAGDNQTESVPSADPDGVVLWYEGSVCYVSTQDKGKVVAVNYGGNLFTDLTKLEEIDFSNADFSECYNFYAMFSGCSSLRTVDLSIVKPETEECDCSYMFQNCSAIDGLDFTPWGDGSNLYSIVGLLSRCTSLKKLKIRNLLADPEYVEGGCVFQDCASLETLDLSGWDVTNLDGEYVSQFFEGCKNLKTIYAQDWSKQLTGGELDDSYDVFSGCVSLPRYSSGKTSGEYCKPDYEGGYFTDPSFAPIEDNSTVKEIFTSKIIAALIRIAKHVEEIDPQ